METLLESLAVELGKLGVKGANVDFKITCGKTGVLVMVYMRPDMDDRLILSIMNTYLAYKPEVVSVNNETIVFRLTGELDLGEHIRSVDVSKDGDVYKTGAQVLCNEETIPLVNKIIEKEPNARYELYKVPGDDALIHISEVDVSYMMKE